MPTKVNSLNLKKAVFDLRQDLPVLISSGYSVDDVGSLFEKDERVGFVQKSDASTPDANGPEQMLRPVTDCKDGCCTRLSPRGF